MMPKYGIATLLEQHPVGYEFLASETPLHITHVDSFEVDLSVDELSTVLNKQLADVSSFSVMATTDEMLGPNKNIPVTTIELNQPLKALHAIIMKALETENAILKNPQFHNEGFYPHVSMYGERRIQPGDIVRIKDISIASKITDGDNPTHKILATIPLHESEPY